MNKLVYAIIILFSGCSSGLSQNNSSHSIDPDYLIDFGNIGKVHVCDSVHEIPLPVMWDSSWTGDGFYYYARFFKVGNKDSIEAILNWDTTWIFQVKVHSSSFKTVEGISVGSSLKDLLTTYTDVYVGWIEPEGDNFFLYVGNGCKGILFRIPESQWTFLYQELWKSNDSNRFDMRTPLHQFPKINQFIEHTAPKLIISDITVSANCSCDK